MFKNIGYSFMTRILSSFFSFVISLYLIREIDVYEFGIFSIVVIVRLILMGFVNGVVSTHYLIERQLVDNVGLFYKYLIIMIAPMFFVFVFVFSFIDIPVTGTVKVAVFLYLIMVCICEFIRTEFSFLGDFYYILLSEVVFVLFFMIGFLFNVYWLEILGLDVVFFSFSFSSLVMFAFLFVGLFKKSIDGWFCFEFVSLKVAGFGWNFLAFVTSIAQNRVPIFFVGFFMGAEAVGFISAARVLFGPVLLMTPAWGGVMRPFLLKIKNDKDKFINITILSILGFVSFNLVLLFFVYVFWSLIEQYLFQKYESIFYLVLLVSFSVLIFQVKNVLSISLQLYEEFKRSSIIMFVGLFVSFGVLTFAILYESIYLFVFSSISADFVFIVFSFLYFYKSRYHEK
jgi:O-antigen/teichoic acid export membrane protein